MLNDLLSLDRISTIAHRGGSKLRPENTVAAFDHALSLAVDAMECDVHLSRDGEVVVIHDATLERTTNARGPVAARTAGELARLDAGFHYRPADGYPFRARGIGVPTLRDVLTRYPGSPFVVEVKGDDPTVALRTVAVIGEAGATSRVILGGFNQTVLDAARRQAPPLVTSASRREARAALTRSYFFLGPRRTGFHVFQMPFRLRGRQMFRRSFVRVMRRAGVPVQAWIVDEADDMRRLIDWGVTGIISDRPDVAVRIIQALGA